MCCVKYNEFFFVSIIKTINQPLFVDETNWRNDYPDEEDSGSDTSLNRRYYEDYGFDSGEERQINAFRVRVAQSFMETVQIEATLLV